MSIHVCRLTLKFKKSLVTVNKLSFKEGAHLEASVLYVAFYPHLTRSISVDRNYYGNASERSELFKKRIFLAHLKTSLKYEILAQEVCISHRMKVLSFYHVLCSPLTLKDFYQNEKYS